MDPTWKACEPQITKKLKSHHRKRKVDTRAFFFYKDQDKHKEMTPFEAELGKENLSDNDCYSDDFEKSDDSFELDDFNLHQ